MQLRTRESPDELRDCLVRFRLARRERDSEPAGEGDPTTVAVDDGTTAEAVHGFLVQHMPGKSTYSGFW